MTSVELTADSPIFSRLSIEYVAAAGPDWFQASAKDRTDGGYVGREVRIIGGDCRTILSHSNGKYYVAPWATIPIGMAYEIHADPAGSGTRWVQQVEQWASPIGNGSGGAYTLSYDTGSGLRKVVEAAPPGTPGQNGDDAEFTIYSDNLKIISANTLRSPPRPQDGNLFVPAGSHTGNDGSVMDVHARLTFGSLIVNPAPWSIMGSIQTDGKDSNGNPVTYSQIFTRVLRADASQQILGEFVIHPTGDFKYVFGNGMACIEDYAGNKKPFITSMEGTWLPTFVGAGNTSYHIRDGWWQRVGNTVECFGRIHILTKDSSWGSYIQIGGLPFAEKPSTMGYYAELTQWDCIALSAGFSTLKAKVRDSSIYLTQMNSTGGNAAYLPASALQSGSNFEVYASYRI